MPIFISCGQCQTTTPLDGPVDFGRPVVCARCGAVVEDFSRAGGPVIPSLATGAQTTRPRTQHQPSVLGHLLGVVAGGAAGLALGYYLLNLLGGPQFDWFKVPLPGVPHTERHRTAGGDGGAQAVPWPGVTDVTPSWAGPAAEPTTTPAAEPFDAAQPSEPFPLHVDQAQPLAQANPFPAESPPADPFDEPAHSAQNIAAVEPPAVALPSTGAPPGELPWADAQSAQPLVPSHDQPAVDAVDPFSPAPGASPAAVDVFATTSQLIERQAPPASAANVIPQQAVGLRDAATISFDELLQRLKQAESTLHCRQCGGTGMVGPPAHASGVVRAAPSGAPQELLPCRQCNGRRVAHVPAEAYRQLCVLAEGATLVRPEANDDALPVRQRMQELLLAVAGSRELLNSMGRQAAYRLEQPVGRLEGVALAGTITELGQQGEMHLARVVLLGAPKAVTVLSAAPIDAHVRDRVVVLGLIAASPTTQLIGYNGPDETVVWGGFRVAWAP